MPKQKPPMMTAFVYDHTKITNWPLWCEPKLDGYRFMCVFDGQGSGKVVQRSGVDYTDKLGWIAEQLAPAVNTVFPEGCMIDGEVFHESWGTTTTLVKTDNKVDRTPLMFYAFDLIDPTSPTLTLSQRKTDLESLLQATEGEAPNWSLTHHVEVHNHDDVVKAFGAFLEYGFEGAMVKDPHAKYEAARRRAWLKYKPWVSTEGRIVGFQKGTNRLAKTLGALMLESADGTRVKVGSGFTDEQRDQIWTDRAELKGKHIEFKYQDDPTAVATYRFPIFLRFRPDLDD